MCKKFLWMLFAMTILIASCERKVRTEFTSEEKILFDSLKLIAFKDIRTKTDAKCNAIKDSLFQVYVDSLYELRYEEVKQIFEK